MEILSQLLATVCPTVLLVLKQEIISRMYQQIPARKLSYDSKGDGVLELKALLSQPEPRVA